MQSSNGAPRRAGQLDEIAEELPRRAAALTRIFLSRTSLGVSRTEVSLLRAIATQPQRITELAAAEGVTQPAITLLVNRLADRGWVAREPDPCDRRAVLVKPTREGLEAYARLRAEYRALLHEEMATLSDEDLDALARAVDVLDELIVRLRERHS